MLESVEGVVGIVLGVKAVNLALTGFDLLVQLLIEVRQVFDLSSEVLRLHFKPVRSFISLSELISPLLRVPLTILSPVRPSSSALSISIRACFIQLPRQIHHLIIKLLDLLVFLLCQEYSIALFLLQLGEPGLGFSVG